jgi:hypothetical protein
LLAKKALPLTETGGVFELLTVAARLASDQARVEEISEEAKRKAAEPFMIAKPSEDEVEFARRARGRSKAANGISD